MPREDIAAALADAAVRGLGGPPTGRAVRTILVAYVVTFAILSLGMLANSGRSSGHLLPDAIGGIAILAGGLLVAFVGLTLLDRESAWVRARDRVDPGHLGREFDRQRRSGSAAPSLRASCSSPSPSGSACWSGGRSLHPRVAPRRLSGCSSRSRSSSSWSSVASAWPAASRSRVSADAGRSDARPASVHAAPHGPHRVRRLLLRGSRPRHRLRDRHPAGQPRRHGWRRLPAAALPARARRGRQPVRGGPRALGVPPAVADADARDHPGHPGQRPADPDGLPRRPGRPPDPALVRAPPRHHRELQPRVPDLLCRGAAPGIGRFARLPHILRSLDTAIAARRRPGGRPDALGRRADRPPGGARDHPGGDRARGHPRHPEHERDPDRQGRPLRRGPRQARGIASRSISSSTASKPRPASTTAARTSAT